VLSEESLSETLLVVIDEVGPFELQGKGWAASLDRLAAKEGIILMMSVRRSMVREVIRHWGLEGRIVFDVNGDNPEECARKILSVAHQSL
jgi:nucleoside-triphosphatase THEP1